MAALLSQLFFFQDSFPIYSFTYRRSFDITVFSSVVVWEIPLPEVGVVLPFGVQLVPPWVESAFRESEKHKKKKNRGQAV